MDKLILIILALFCGAIAIGALAAFEAAHSVARVI